MICLHVQYVNELLENTDKCSPIAEITLYGKFAKSYRSLSVTIPCARVARLVSRRLNDFPAGL